MKANIDVKNKDEKRAVELAMADPSVRALVLTMGYLIPLPSDRSRARVLSWAADMCDERDKIQIESATKVDAVDPHVQSEGTPTTRV